MLYWEIYEFFKTAETANGDVLLKGVLKNFAISTSKHFCWSLFANLQACNFIKRLEHRSFPVNIAKLFRTPILKSI